MQIEFVSKDYSIKEILHQVLQDSSKSIYICQVISYEKKPQQKIIPSHGALQHMMELWNTLNPVILLYMILSE